MITLGKLLFLIILTEALVELICKAEILERPRNYVKSWGWFTRNLLECYYCTSVWVGLIVAPLYFMISNTLLFVFCIGIVIHRLSNYLHLLFSILRDHQITTRINRSYRR